MNECNKNMNGKLNTVQQIMEQSNLGRSTVIMIAKNSGALIKIGKIVRIDSQKFFDYLTREYTVI